MPLRRAASHKIEEQFTWAHLDTPTAAVRLISMVNLVDESRSSTDCGLIGDDSPLLELLPVGSTERDKAQCVRKLLQLALELEDDL